MDQEQDITKKNPVNVQPSSRRNVITIIVVVIIGFLLAAVVIIHHKIKYKNVNQNNTNQSNQQTNSSAGFPNISVSYFNVSKNVDSQIGRLQMVDFDNKHNRVLFYPYGTLSSTVPGTTVPPTASGDLLVYDVGDGSRFTNASNYHTYDLTKIVSPDAVGFGGGCIDDQSTFSYLVPSLKVSHGKTVSNGLAVQINLNKDLSTKGAYTQFDVSSVLAGRDLSWFSCVYGNGAIYFTPALNFDNGKWHGNFLRFDTSKSFNDPSAWQWFDTATLAPNQPAGQQTAGFQSIAYNYPWIYLIPYNNGTLPSGITPNSELVRYNVTKPFKDSSSYQWFNIQNITTNTNVKDKLVGFTGGLVANNWLVLVPWKKYVNPTIFQQTGTSLSMAVAFDTRKDITDTTAWKYFDLSQLDSDAAGYQAGWVDKNGFVWPGPMINYNSRRLPPFVAWDSSKPFDQASSWHVYSHAISRGNETGTTGTVSTGAAYDPNTNTAWMAPYGTVMAPDFHLGLVTQIQESN